MASFLRQLTSSVFLPREQAASPTFAIFAPMVSILLTFIQTLLTFIPFETHPFKFTVAILSLLAFFCLFAIGSTQNFFPNHAPKLFMAIKCTASLSVALLVSLLLPQPWDQVPYVTYFLSACHCLGLLRNINLAYYHDIAYGFVRSSRARLQQLRQTRRPPLPLQSEIAPTTRLPTVDQSLDVRTVH